MYKKLDQLLLSNASKKPEEQKKSLIENLENWKGKLEQVDDVCVIGIRFNNAGLE